MTRRSIPLRILLGAVSGAAATFVLQALMKQTAKTFPDSKPPMKGDAGEFMVDKAESLLSESTREKIPEKAEAVAAKSLHLGYGMTAGVLYAVLRGNNGWLLVDGPLLGLAVWGVGYLGWLPATDLMPPITEHSPQQVIAPIVQHAVFGLAAVSAYQGMTRAGRRSEQVDLNPS
jgi:hypothetical protein